MNSHDEMNEVGRPTQNSRGHPIHPFEGAIDSFWKWFGNSCVTDRKGRPLVVYHGTNTEFSSFAKGDIGYHFGPLDAAHKRLDDIRTSKDEVYAARQSGQEHIMPVYLSIKNPLRMGDAGDWANADALVNHVSDLMSDDAFHDAYVAALEKIGDLEGLAGFRAIFEEMGYDGIVYDNVAEGGGDSYIAFRPEQIKSATGNLGLFDGSNADLIDGGGVEIGRRLVMDAGNTLDDQGFQEWFGESGVTTPSGQPLPVFHGTHVDLESFETNTGLIWFTDDQSAADTYGDPGKTITAYLSLQAPARDRDVFKVADEMGLDPGMVADEYGAKILEVDGVREALIHAGFDGAIVGDATADGEEDVTAFVAFFPDQIVIAGRGLELDEQQEDIPTKRRAARPR